MSKTCPVNADVEQGGFAIVPGVIGGEERRELIALLGDVSGAGRRGLLGLPAVAALARSSRLLDLVQGCFPGEEGGSIEPVPVRAIYFDKSPSANWLVPWHQDLTLALRDRAEIPGFGPWSVKEGIPHVQPPMELLRQMLAVRLHLDDTDATNGALRVLQVRTAWAGFRRRASGNCARSVRVFFALHPPATPF